jgi:coproporphyrinogen III oxidase-like Fe-S oxidoreductase
MLTEHIMTAFLKRKYSQVLQLDSFAMSHPPEPVSGKNYLVYIHVPFCQELCPYCSFHRMKLDEDLARAHFRAIRKELQMYKDLGYDFKAAYIGGGTPTILADEIAEVLESLRSTFNMREISLETNPNHLTDEIVNLLKTSGINRLSVGVQSFNDSLLKTMERYHKYGSGSDVRDRLQRYTGSFDTLNVDMIFNFPTQTLEMLERDLTIIQDIAADQVTFYPLMVSDITRRELARRFGKISYRQEKLFYNRILEALENSYTPCTAWCFSRKNTMIDEYVVDYDEYVGVGSGSFGYIGGSVLANTFSIPDYIEKVNTGCFPLEAAKTFSETDRIQYDFLMKLFSTSLNIGAAEDKFQGRFFHTLRKEIALFRILGAIFRDNGTLRLTRKGLYYWVIMMREFFTGVNNFRDTCRARVGTIDRLKE